MIPNGSLGTKTASLIWRQFAAKSVRKSNPKLHCLIISWPVIGPDARCISQCNSKHPITIKHFKAQSRRDSLIGGLPLVPLSEFPWLVYLYFRKQFEWQCHETFTVPSYFSLFVFGLLAVGHFRLFLQLPRSNFSCVRMQFVNFWRHFFCYSGYGCRLQAALSTTSPDFPSPTPSCNMQTVISLMSVGGRWAGTLKIAVVPGAGYNFYWASGFGRQEKQKGGQAPVGRAIKLTA